VTVSGGVAMIVRAEILMPEDVNRLFEAGWSDSVYLHKGPMAVRGTINACMFCDNTGIFMCELCGRMSCVQAGWPILLCPVCKGSVGVRQKHFVTEGFMPLSSTGFIHQWGRFRLRRDGSPWFTGERVTGNLHAGEGREDAGIDDLVVRETVVEGTVIDSPSLPQPAKQIEPPRPLELPSPEKEDARARLRKFLSDQRKGGEGEKP
jgi:hypothetical protein